MLTRVVLLSVLTGLTAGCSQQSSSPMRPSSPSVLQVAPADGATAVRLDAGVQLSFGVAVDRSAVERGFHLISEANMTGPCPDSSMGTHGSMDNIMGNPSMLAHMDAVHATHGGFSWNAAGTSCTFMPDSLMRPETHYMMHMSREMLDMMGQMGGSMGGGHMTGSGDMVAHFQTMTSDDHGSHHP